MTVRITKGKRVLMECQVAHMVSARDVISIYWHDHKNLRRQNPVTYEETDDCGRHLVVDMGDDLVVGRIYE